MSNNFAPGSSALVGFWNTPAAPPAPTPTLDNPPAYPAYVGRPDRWDVRDLNNMQPGETQAHYYVRALAAARYWAQQDELEGAAYEAAAKDADAKLADKRRKNAEAQARWRAKHSGVANAGPAKAAYDAAVKERRAAIQKWDDHVRRLWAQWQAEKKAQPSQAGDAAQGG